jgi:hypothetical protein
MHIETNNGTVTSFAGFRENPENYFLNTSDDVIDSFRGIRNRTDNLNGRFIPDDLYADEPECFEKFSESYVATSPTISFSCSPIFSCSCITLFPKASVIYL